MNVSEFCNSCWVSDVVSKLFSALRGDFCLRDLPQHWCLFSWVRGSKQHILFSDFLLLASQFLPEVHGTGIAKQPPGFLGRANYGLTKCTSWHLYVQWNLNMTNLYITKSSVELTVFLIPAIVKSMEKNLDLTKPHYGEHILPVPLPFVMSRLHCTIYYWVTSCGPFELEAVFFCHSLHTFKVCSMGHGRNLLQTILQWKFQMKILMLRVILLKK